ncbi:aspartyl/asparaginyl beta-hydroxylase domain-containing protein [uncultured Cyclobacterium sp.]|uniref:aspartyl/asparaginyl beta-hydroxylase domain-containing protein n=1 Tax=uncultured Cyclobacterium sp. TaxID=453820 RepID=UPI0030EE0F42|tara:strand:+ start:77493 stop:78077 length:585 start_codon:yes stop_codon:yes gene_type:complete
MEKNSNKTNSVRVLGEVDVLPLLQLLPELMQQWDTDAAINPNKKYSLAQVNHINFRWSNKKSDPVDYFDLPLWEKYRTILLPIMKQAVKPFGYKSGYFPRVMFAKMQPGTIIPEHIDGNTRGWIPHKIHVPMITNPDVAFTIRGVSYNFTKGTAVEVDNSGLHGVKNTGKTARIHFIFEYLDGSINKIPQNDLA